MWIHILSIEKLIKSVKIDLESSTNLLNFNLKIYFRNLLLAGISDKCLGQVASFISNENMIEKGRHPHCSQWDYARKS